MSKNLRIYKETKIHFLSILVWSKSNGKREVVGKTRIKLTVLIDCQQTWDILNE
jgi:hypothetical protein